MLKQWYQSSLRNQILVWLLSINLLVLLLMFVATFQISRNIIEKNIIDQLEREQVIHGELIESYLNQLVDDLKVLSNQSVFFLALKSPSQAKTLDDLVLKTRTFIQRDQGSLFLVNNHGEPIYKEGDVTPWQAESSALAMNALSVHTAKASIVPSSNGFSLQIAQPIESKGVLLLKLPLAQLLRQFSQGKNDITAWELSDESGQVISNSSSYNGFNEAIIEEMFSQLQSFKGTEYEGVGEFASTWRNIKSTLRLLPPLQELHLQLNLREKKNWTTIIGVQLLTPFVIVFLLICLMAFVFIVIAGRRLATPLEQLTSYALDIWKLGLTQSIGNQSLAQLVKRSDEVGRLGAQFLQMLEGLRQGYLGLEKKVAERTAQLETIFLLSPDGFMEISDSGNVIFVNPALETLLGLSAEDVVGKSIDNFLQKIASKVQTHTFLQLENMFLASDQVHWLQLQQPYLRTLAVLVKINQHNDRIIYLRDITQDAEFEEMRNAFMSTAAHELRTPISSILGYAQLLKRRLEGVSSEDGVMVKDMVNVIERQAKNIADLVNDLLDLSRLEHEIVKGLDLTQTSLVVYLRPLVKQFLMPGDAREITMHVDDHMPDVRLHPDSFKRLLVNLLSNAFKYSPAGSPIYIQAFSEKKDGKQFVVVKLRDYGYGMSPEDLEHVFERFYRGGVNPEIPGTGLGLSIAQDIMQAHDGKIAIESELNVGTTITLSFPVARIKAPLE